MLQSKRNKQCGRKTPHPTETAALAAMDEVMRMAGGLFAEKYGRRQGRAYQCKHCGMWHWGHV